MTPADFQRQILLGARLSLSADEMLELAAVSALPWCKAKDFLALPDRVNDLTILDVGAGGSDITATLLEMGADAFAIDPRYRKKSEVEESVRAQFHSPSCPMATRILLNQTLKRFLASVKATPQRYKPAFATEIPFADNSFDLVFSIDTVTAFLDRDRELLFASIEECLRVTKPGGTLRFSPFQDCQPSWPRQVNELRMCNDAELLAWLKNHPKVEQVDVTQTSANNHHCLSFRKTR